MIKLYLKNEEVVFAELKGVPILQHFEFKCRCMQNRCKYTAISTVLIEKFKALRKLIDQPLRINSGFRCASHNLAEGGSDLSQHQLGFAMDLVCPVGMPLEKFEMLARMIGFSYTQIYGKENFLHVDVRNLD